MGYGCEWLAKGVLLSEGDRNVLRLQARCELCGGKVITRKCKIICLNCGYTRDCSDPAVRQPVARYSVSCSDLYSDSGGRGHR